jgi:hypothetical protein
MVYTGTDHYAEALPLFTKLLVLLINCTTINCSSLTMIKWGAKRIYLCCSFWWSSYANLWWNNFLDTCTSWWKYESSDFGINGGWGGIRTTSAFVDKFDANTTDTVDNYKDGQTKEIKEIEISQMDMLFRNLEM